MKKSLVYLIFLVGLTQTFPRHHQDLTKIKFQPFSDAKEDIGVTGITKKTSLNNYPGFTVPRPFAAFHPTIMKIMNQIVKDLKEKSVDESVESPVYQPALKPFSPMHFRIIG